MDSYDTGHATLHISDILGAMGQSQGATPWLCDNRGAIRAATIMGFNGRTEHLNIKLKYSSKYIEKQLFALRYVPTTK